MGQPIDADLTVRECDKTKATAADDLAKPDPPLKQVNELLKANELPATADDIELRLNSGGFKRPPLEIHS